MNLTIRLLGVEVFAVSTESSSPDSVDHGDCTTTAFGFGEFTTDTRWQPGGEP